MTDTKNINDTLASGNEMLEELVEDMSNVFSQFKKTNDNVLRLEELSKKQDAGLAEVRRELQSFKAEIQGQKVSTAFSSAFKLVVQKLDQLEIAHQQLDEEEDIKFKTQLESVIDVLKVVLDGFGYKQFVVNAGEDFNPGKMNCMGKTKGEKNKVVRVISSGYTNADMVVKTASVIIGE